MILNNKETTVTVLLIHENDTSQKGANNHI